MKNKISKQKIFEILAIILIAIYSITLTPRTLQNDTFYTIKIGELITQTKNVDMLEHFSWHSGLEYTYPHWLYDTLTYLIYNNMGQMTGIYVVTCILAAILGITIYRINRKIAKNQFLSFIIAMASMYMLKDFITARAQLVTFILFALELFFIEKLVDTNNKKYGIPIIIISILIANLHVAVWSFFFILGLPYIAEYIVRIIEEKMSKKYGKEIREDYKIIIPRREGAKTLILIMIICIFTGLLTPLGSTPYTYLLKTMAGTTTQSINEHQPLVLFSNINVLVILIVALTILTFTKVKIKLSDLFMLAGLIALTFYSKRQSTMLIIIGLPIVNKLVYEWFSNGDEQTDKKLIDMFVNKIGVPLITIVALLLSLYTMKPKIGTPYVDEKSYPVEMSNFIIEYFNNDFTNVRLYNQYNYGSYLLYRGIPVFIDSRADLYDPVFNKGVNVFTDFIECDNLEVYFEDTFKKYDITHVILYKDSRINMIIKNAELKNYKLLKQDDYFVFYEIEK